MLSRPSAFSAVLFVTACSVSAQVDTSTSIRGLVTDPAGASVHGAIVTIRSATTAGERATVKDASSLYSLPSIAPGTYFVTVRHPGFERSEITDRVAGVAQVAQVDVRLEVGESIQPVTVSAAGAELIDTSSAAVSGTIVSNLANTLPLNWRNIFDLAVTLPNVSLQSLGSYASMGSSSQKLCVWNDSSQPAVCHMQFSLSFQF